MTSAMNEHQHQVMLFKWMDSEGILAFAVPNSGKRSMAQANYMRQEGMRKGVPDILVCEPCGQYHGLFIEMKKPKTGKLSEEQREWLHELSLKGYATAVCYGFNEAKETVENYLREGTWQ